MAKTDDRLFAPFPIEMDEHPKIMPLSDAAFRALFEATFYSRRMLSDGFLDERVVLKRWGREVADELSANDPERPSWVRVEAPKPGWRIHDFEKHHPLRADVEEKRARTSEVRSESGRKGAAKRWQTDSKTVANDSSETETETPSSTKKVGRASRGTRIPDDFTVTTEMVAWARDNTPLVDGKRATERFMNHFQSVSGQRGIRIDWLKTWRNWLLSDQEKAERTTKATPSEKARRTVMLATELLEVES